MNGKLDIGTPGFDADLPDDVNGCIPHSLILPISEGLSRGDSDTVTGVDAHWIKIFNRADDNHVVFEIAHNFQLIFLPANKGLFHDNLGNHARLESCACKGFHLFPVIGHTAADSAQGKTGPDNEGIADRLSHLFGLIHIPDNSAPGHTQTDAIHGISELLPIFGLLDDRYCGSDHLHTQSLQ